MRTFLLVSLLSILSVAAAVPQGAPVSTGPWGGYVQHLAADSSGRVYAATFLGGIFRTSNAGDLWEDLYDDTLLIDARTLAIGPGGAIYVGLDPGFMRSTDDGASWQKMSNLLNTRTVVSLLVLPGGTLLAGTLSSGVYRSTDNGASFTQSNDSLTNTFVLSLAATPAGDTVYAATYGGGVFRSTNAGTSWSPVNNGLTQNLVAWVGVAPDGALFACAGGTIFRSTDAGANWSDLGLPTGAYRGIAFTAGGYYSPVTGGVFTGGGVYASTDGGTTWNPEPGLPGQFYISILASGGNVFAGAAGLGVYRRPAASGTQGAWVQVVEGMANTLITSLAMDAAGVIYAASRHAGIFRSADSGATWVNYTDGMPAGEWINDIAVNPATGTILAAGVYNSYRSTDGGATWPVSTMGQSDLVACSPSGIVFASLGGNIRRSTDDGESWTGQNLSGVVSIRDAAFHDSTVYLATGVGSGFGTSRGVWRSTDNGVTWAAFNDSLPDLNVVAVAVADTGAAPDTIAAPKGSAAAGGCDKVVVAGTRNGAVYGLQNDRWIEAGTGITPQFRLSGFSVGALATDRSLYVFGDRGEIAERPEPLCTWTKRVQLPLYAEVRGIIVVRTASDDLGVMYGTMGGGVINRVSTTTGVGPGPALPERFALHQNYPNPFNPGTTIRFDVPTAGHVSVRVFDVLGREAAVLADGFEPPGEKLVTWDAAGAAGGVYFVRLTAGESRATIKMILLK